jgi:hypothetical protein
MFLANHLVNLIEAARGLGDTEGVAEAEHELATLRDSDPAMAALDARLAAILKGDQRLGDAVDRLQLAQRAYDKALYATAARLWGEAIAADPKLGDDRRASHRYNAACAAALAGSGQGKDEPRPDEAARAKLRSRALVWLRAELSAWEGIAKLPGAGPRQVGAQHLKHWKVDTDLGGLRDAKPLAALPDEERAALRGLWGDVDALLTKVAAGQPSPPAGEAGLPRDVFARP